MFPNDYRMTGKVYKSKNLKTYSEFGVAAGCWGGKRDTIISLK